MNRVRCASALLASALAAWCLAAAPQTASKARPDAAPPTAPQAAPAVPQSRLDAALALVPADALGAVVIPNPKAASDDIAQCIDRMGRPESPLLGRPIDSIKAALGIGGGLDDSAPIVVWWQWPSPDADRAALPMSVASVGTTDATQFLEANLSAAPDVAADAWRRGAEIVYARSVGTRVLLSSSAELVRRWAPDSDFAATLRSHVGERGMQLVGDAECSAWAGPAALEAMRAQAVASAKRAIEESAGDVDEAQRALDERRPELDALPRFTQDVRDALVTFDVDPLGLSIRSLSVFEPGSALGKLTRGGGAVRTDAAEGADGASSHGDPGFNRLPGNARDLLLALAVDWRGEGEPGGGAGNAKSAPGGSDAPGDGDASRTARSERSAVMRQLAALAEVEGFVPKWATENAGAIERVQLGLYRSKLGLASGILNDSALFIETKDPVRVRALLRAWIESMSGREPFTGAVLKATWEETRTLKSGETVSAFEVVEESRPAGEGAGNAFMLQMAKHFIFGPRGFRGFVRTTPDGVVMTMSQRTDVLARATEAAEGTSTLAENGAVRALRRWLVADPDVEVLVGIGPILRMEQVARLLGLSADGAGVPDRIEPVAFAAAARGGGFETATMIPTGVLALVVDRVVTSRLGGGGAAARAPENEAAPHASPDPDAKE